MTDEKDETGRKQPIEMTSDELLDYSLAPELAEKLREIAHGENSNAKGLEEEDV
jgi:hypothetical protein